MFKISQTKSAILEYFQKYWSNTHHKTSSLSHVYQRYTASKTLPTSYGLNIDDFQVFLPKYMWNILKIMTYQNFTWTVKPVIISFNK